MKITSKEIARACGVSRGSVDRALNGRPGINEDTKKIILETAQKLGYKPHYLASSLAKGKTMTLGLVVFDVRNRFFAQLVNAIELNARDKGYFVYLTLTDKDSLEERDCIEHLVGRNVDGIILCSAVKDEEYISYLNNMNLPLVTVGNLICSSIPFVGINDYQAMYDAAGYVMGKDYTDILYVSPPLHYDDTSNIFAQKQRYLGFEAVVKKSSKNISCSIADNRDYLLKIDSFLSKSKGRKAIICSSDVYVLEVLNHIKLKGLSVPGDLGLMGFDNIDTLRYVEPRLSTVSYPIEDIAAKAVECIIDKIERNSTRVMSQIEARLNDSSQIDLSQNIIFPHQIIEGASL